LGALATQCYTTLTACGSRFRSSARAPQHQRDPKRHFHRSHVPKREIPVLSLVYTKPLSKEVIFHRMVRSPSRFLPATPAPLVTERQTDGKHITIKATAFPACFVFSITPSAADIVPCPPWAACYSCRVSCSRCRSRYEPWPLLHRNAAASLGMLLGLRMPIGPPLTTLSEADLLRLSRSGHLAIRSRRTTAHFRPLTAKMHAMHCATSGIFQRLTWNRRHHPWLTHSPTIVAIPGCNPTPPAHSEDT
jgi:hypothetical protein